MRAEISIDRLGGIELFMFMLTYSSASLQVKDARFSEGKEAVEKEPQKKKRKNCAKLTNSLILKKLVFRS